MPNRDGKPVGMVRVLSDSLRFFTNNLGRIVALCLPFILGSMLFGYLLKALWPPGAMGGMMAVDAYVPLVADLFFYPIYTGALIVFMAKRTAGESPGNGEILRTALAVWRPFFLLNLAVTALVVIGLFLFIIPGVWLMVRLVFAKFLLVLNRVGPAEAMQQSLTLSKPRFWLIFRCMYVVIVTIFLLNMLMGGVIGQLGGGIVVIVVVASLFGILSLYLTVVMFRIFMLAAEEGNEE